MTLEKERKKKRKGKIAWKMSIGTRNINNILRGERACSDLVARQWLCLTQHHRSTILLLLLFDINKFLFHLFYPSTEYCHGLWELGSLYRISASWHAVAWAVITVLLVVVTIVRRPTIVEWLVLVRVIEKSVICQRATGVTRHEVTRMLRFDHHSSIRTHITDNQCPLWKQYSPSANYVVVHFARISCLTGHFALDYSALILLQAYCLIKSPNGFIFIVNLIVRGDWLIQFRFVFIIVRWLSPSRFTLLHHCSRPVQPPFDTIITPTLPIMIMQFVKQISSNSCFCFFSLQSQRSDSTANHEILEFYYVSHFDW